MLFRSGDVVEAPPLIHAGSVYVGSSNGKFFALDLESGAERWVAETGDKILGGANVVAVADDVPVDEIAAAVRFALSTPSLVGAMIRLDGGRDAALAVETRSEGD